MTCPVCGERTEIKDSRKETDCVRRRRICVSCKYIFYTIEMEENLISKFTKKVIDK